MTEEKNKKGLGTTQIILIVGIVVLCVVVGVAGFIIYQKISAPAPAALPAAGGNLVIDESNLEEMENQIKQSVEDGMFEVNMNTEWFFPDGATASSNAFVANGVSNKYSISFEILLNETENIYTSTVIPVGKQIKDIVLEKDLDAGVYEALCLYHLWKEDGTENSQFGVNVKLTIEE